MFFSIEIRGAVAAASGGSLLSFDEVPEHRREAAFCLA
jgi:hypothetical protein